MKKYLLLSATFCLLVVFCNAQTNYTFPKGYTAYKDYDGHQVRNDNDYDGDGVTDLTILCKNIKDNSLMVVVFLSSRYIVNGIYSYFPWDATFIDFSFSNNVLTLSSSFGTGRFSKKLKLKYYSDLGNMRLIGYDEEYFGNAANEGAYKKTVNLLSGQYEVGDGVMRKISLDVITLSNIEKYFDYLNSIGSNYIK